MEEERKIIKLIPGRPLPEDGQQDERPQEGQPDMDEITREELDAKLETIEAKTDARVARIEAAIDSMRMETHSVKNWVMGGIITVVITVVAAAFGTVWGVYGANASIVQAVITAFQAGQQSPSKK
jgi:hypothetical protein